MDQFRIRSCGTHIDGGYFGLVEVKPSAEVAGK